MRRLTLALTAVLVGSFGITIASQRSAASMSSAAEKWLASLTPDEKQRAVFSFDSEERLHWHFVPNEQFPRKGVQIKEMSDSQRTLAWDLLKTGVSARGYSTARAIMELENILKSVEGPAGRFARDHEAYQFSVFGTPGDRKAWGWRFEGHHVSIRFDVVNGSPTSSTPSFFGANPAEVRVDVPGAAPRGTRVLGPEEDAARALLDSLDASEKTTAIVANAAPNEMLTSNNLKADPQSPLGLKASAMTARAARQTDGAHRRLRGLHGGRRCGRAHGSAEESRSRHHRVRMVWRNGEGEEALLPRSGTDVPH
jgi:hypothetical protein